MMQGEVLTVTGARTGKVEFNNTGISHVQTHRLQLPERRLLHEGNRETIRR